MFFLIGFIWHVAASFAFLIAILTSNWFSLSNVSGSLSGTVQRGVFYVCDVIATTSISQQTECASILDAQPGNIPKNRLDDRKKYPKSTNSKQNILFILQNLLLLQQHLRSVVLDLA